MNAARSYLVDTGPLVAFLDKADSAHPFVSRGWSQLRGIFLTTGAVITEALHFLKGTPGAPEAISTAVATNLLLIEDTFQPADLQTAAALMDRYADTPMDFADASLVVLAQRLSIPRILTLDERGFRTYRFGRNKHFHLVLQDDLN